MNVGMSIHAHAKWGQVPATIVACRIDNSTRGAGKSNQ